MNDDVKHLIEQLREPVWGEPVRVVNDRLRTAALFLESLAAELEQVKRDRDAAVEDVAKLKRCEHCIGYEEFLKIDGNIERCNACEERSHWQWRGVKEG